MEGQCGALLGCLIPTEDLSLLCALYACGSVKHEHLACPEDPEFLERRLRTSSASECLMLCRALCVSSYGVDSPLAIEVLLGSATVWLLGLPLTLYSGCSKETRAKFAHRQV